MASFSLKKGRSILKLIGTDNAKIGFIRSILYPLLFKSQIEILSGAKVKLVININSIYIVESGVSSCCLPKRISKDAF